jgi:uncharacterized membrane protein
MESVFLLGVITSIFWMYVGWQAMRAHQRLAAAAEDLARKTQGPLG